MRIEIEHRNFGLHDGPDACELGRQIDASAPVDSANDHQLRFGGAVGHRRTERITIKVIELDSQRLHASDSSGFSQFGARSAIQISRRRCQGQAAPSNSQAAGRGGRQVARRVIGHQPSQNA